MRAGRTGTVELIESQKADVRFDAAVPAARRTKCHYDGSMSALLLVALQVASPSFVQTMPPYRPLSVTRGDANGTVGTALLFEPIQLGLLADAPAGFSASGPCEDGAGPWSGWRSYSPQTTTTPTAYVARTVQLVPQLHLVGFSRMGCAFDGATGGAIVLTRPLTSTTSLALSGGALLLPSFGPGATPVTVQQLRADVRGRGPVVFGVVATPQGSARVTFGGSF